ncbi:MAG TPA: hypothetical protein ACFCUD_06870 [Cyclobacteriaceae bacterium]
MNRTIFVLKLKYFLASLFLLLLPFISDAQLLEDRNKLKNVKSKSKKPFFLFDRGVKSTADKKRNFKKYDPKTRSIINIFNKRLKDVEPRSQSPGWGNKLRDPGIRSASGRWTIKRIDPNIRSASGRWTIRRTDPNIRSISQSQQFTLDFKKYQKNRPINITSGYQGNIKQGGLIEKFREYMAQRKQANYKGSGIEIKTDKYYKKRNEEITSYSEVVDVEFSLITKINEYLKQRKQANFIGKEVVIKPDKYYKKRNKAFSSFDGMAKRNTKGKSMHPSAAYLTGKRISSDKISSGYKSFHLFWTRTFGNKVQPDAVTDKPKKPKFDKKEKEIWYY